MFRIYFALGGCFFAQLGIISCSTISKFQYITDVGMSTVTINESIRIGEDVSGVRPIIRLPREGEKVNTTCALGSIPGNLFGIASDKLFNRFDIIENKADLRLKAANFQNHLEISRARRTGLEVEFEIHADPPEAEFSRVATVCVNFISSLASDDSQKVILMYFDRPIKLKGTLKTKSHEVIVDLSIPTKGFHYISEKSPKLNTYVYDTIYSGKNIYYTVSDPTKK